MGAGAGAVQKGKLGAGAVQKGKMGVGGLCININIKIIIQASVHLVRHERLLAKSLGFYVFSQMAKNLEFVFLIPSFFIFAFL